jgi:hypothetical protein
MDVIRLGCEVARTLKRYVDGETLMPRVCTICTHPACVTIDEGLVTGQSLRAISAAYGVSKSAVDRHKESHLAALPDQERADLKREFQAARQADQQRSQQLRWNARAVMRAMQGWRDVRTVEEWQAACEDARERYQSGRFLLERLGAERFLDPQLMATIWQLRQGFMEEYGAESPAMTMVIDLAVMAYTNALRVQGWIGDLALSIEHELFAEDSLKVTLRQQYGPHFDGFVVKEALRRLREQLLPLFERVNRQLLQNLQALPRHRHGSSPMVAIGRAGQVNVAQQQVNFPRTNGHSSPLGVPR